MFSQRSQEKEILDMGSEYYSQEEYEECMKKLFSVNRLFGFFYSTRTLLRKYAKNSAVVDVGCGSGLFLLNLSRYFPQMKMSGIDISEQAIQLANTLQKKTPSKNVTFKRQELASLQSEHGNIDIVLATLVCHHLDHDDLAKFLSDAQSIAAKAVIINDLHRHPLAYYFYKIISPIFKNKLITNDGLISICRGFTRKELQNILKHASITHYQIKWCFPFRWRIIIWKP